MYFPTCFSQRARVCQDMGVFSVREAAWLFTHQLVTWRKYLCPAARDYHKVNIYNEKEIIALQS